MSKNRILFVDDESNILSGLRRRLRAMRNEWDMLFANGANEALEIIEQEKIDVVVSDMRMPEFDGAYLLNVISRKHPEIIRLILSGQSEQDKLLKIVSTAHQFLSKPCDTDLLIKTIRQATEHRKLTIGNEQGHFVTQVGSLMTQRSVFEQLREFIDQDEVDTEGLFDVVKSDVGLVAKTMQLVNSSFFHNGRPVEDVASACRALGKNLIGSLINESTAFIVPEQDSLCSQLVDQINQETIEVTQRAIQIARLDSDDEEIHSKIFMAGMLHDVGRIVFAQNWPEKASVAMNLGIKDQLEYEKLEFGLSHEDTGAILLNLWGIGEECVQASAFHHSPEKSPLTNTSPLAYIFVASQSLHASRDEANSILENEFIQRTNSSNRVAGWLDSLYPASHSIGEKNATKISPLC